VIRLVARDSVEEKMYAIQRRKLNLIEDVVEPGEGDGTAAMTEDELREILSI